MSTITTSDTSTPPQGEREILEAEPMEATKYARARPPFCGAKSKAGTSCKLSPAKGRTRCRFHGGGKGSGGQMGEANGSFRHGGFTQDAVALRRKSSSLLRVVK